VCSIAAGWLDVNARLPFLDNYFRFALRFNTLTLAHENDSLVRVSRRDRQIRHAWRSKNACPNHFCCPKLNTKSMIAWFKMRQTASNGLQVSSKPVKCTQSTALKLRPNQSTFLLAISVPFNSLSRVLFIFPSRYLWTIGLLLIFSFRWSLSPT
jgi:hypothetical protein